VVRYAALMALVLWVGVLFHGTFHDAVSPAISALVFGGVLLGALVIWKLAGPPPASFFTRLGLAAGMVALAAIGWRSATDTLEPVALALGCVLLGFYAREI